MANAKVKTTENNSSVEEFIKSTTSDERQKDAFTILKLMEKLSGFKPKMWGPAIIGFGSYHYKYESGREGDAPIIAFSPRKNAFTLYLSSTFKNREELLKKFGKYTNSKHCIYFKKIADINLEILSTMIKNSLETENKFC